MIKTYDVIVVGAGNGGLIAAATTAKSGLKTLIIEKHNLPGGCASSFVRGRFEFEPSLHELCSVGSAENPYTIYKYFDNLGAKIDWRYEKDCFRVICTAEDGYDVVVRGGRQGFIDSLEAAVPGSKESLEKFFALGDAIRDAMAYMGTVKIPNPITLLGKHGDFINAGCHSAEEAMRAIGMPQKTMDIINTYWCYLGVPTDELNAMHFISMVTDYIDFGAAMPKNRSHELSLALEKVIRDNGGDVWYNTEVTGFLFDEENAVCGVKIGDKEVRAKKVISNVIPDNVYNMIGDYDKIPERCVKLANARELGMSVVTCYLGLDCAKEELGIKDYTVFVTSDRNPRKQYEGVKDGSLFIVNCLNAVIPDATEAGTCTLFFTLPLFVKDFPVDLTEKEYKKWKNAFVEKYIERYEKLMGIDIRSHIEEIAIATPVTFARYLGTPAGTIYGYASLGWDNVLLRSVFKSTGFDGAIKNLEFCGGHAELGDGYSSAYSSGDATAKKVIAELSEEADDE